MWLSHSHLILIVYIASSVLDVGLSLVRHSAWWQSFTVSSAKSISKHARVHHPKRLFVCLLVCVFLVHVLFTLSSRSHLLLKLVVFGVNRLSKAMSQGSLTLVDLAGSERVSRSEATGQRLVEAAAINKSLSALGQVSLSGSRESYYCGILVVSVGNDYELARSVCVCALCASHGLHGYDKMAACMACCLHCCGHRRHVDVSIASCAFALPYRADLGFAETF